MTGCLSVGGALTGMAGGDLFGRGLGSETAPAAGRCLTGQPLGSETAPWGGALGGKASTGRALGSLGGGACIGGACLGGGTPATAFVCLNLLSNSPSNWELSASSATAECAALAACVTAAACAATKASRSSLNLVFTTTFLQSCHISKKSLRKRLRLLMH